MAVYLAAGAAAIIYLLALPVRAGLAWRTGGQLRAGVAIGPFRFSAHGGFHYAPGSGLTAALTHDRSGKTHELSLTQRMAGLREQSDKFASLRPALGYLLDHLHPQHLRARVHLSLPDAAKTAFFYGLLRAALSTLHAVRPALPLNASVTADFRSGRTQADLYGILSCRLGHIMAAGLIWCRNDLSRRIHSWITSNRSKAS